MAAIALLLAGYLLLMLSNPVRHCLRDGWLCVRRYPLMWRVLAGLGFANALFHFSVRLTLHLRGSPQFSWVRADWMQGSIASNSWSPSVVRECFFASGPLSLEALAGLFNNAVTTFPIAVFAAIGLFVNRRRTLSLLQQTLSKRFGIWSLPMIALALACAIAVIAKAVLYFWRPEWLGDEGWLRSAQIAMWPAALFECAFGLGVQAWLLLYAYAWVRGMSFDRDAMRDVAVRRLGAMAKWAGLVMILQSVCIELPLTLSLTRGLPVPPEVAIARVCLASVLIFCCSMQASLTLHGETLGRAWRAHWRLVCAYWWDILWFLLIAGLNLFALNFLREGMLRVLDKDTAPGVAWTLLWPLLSGLVTAWLIAAWVCLFKRCDPPAPRKDKLSPDCPSSS